MAFLAPAAAAATSSFRVPASSGRRTALPAAVKATASSVSTTSPHPILSSLRMAASAAVLLAATSPALACTPSAPPPTTPLSIAVHPDSAADEHDPIQDASHSSYHFEKLIIETAARDVHIQEDDASSESHDFEKLIVETAALARAGGAEAARARLSAADGCESESYAARLLAAQALFVDGMVDEAIAAFEELALEDPADYRPLFCQSVLYLVLGRGAESEFMLQRCRDVGGDALYADLTLMVSPAGAEAVDAESGAEELEPEQAEV